MGNLSKNKIGAFFKIDAKLDAALKEKAEQSGYTQTRIVEDALESWLNGGLSRELAAASQRVNSSASENDSKDAKAKSAASAAAKEFLKRRVDRAVSPKV
jgi:hypothetical protein